MAKNFDDAKAGISELHFGKFGGILVATTPATPTDGLLVRIIPLLRYHLRFPSLGLGFLL